MSTTKAIHYWTKNFLINGENKGETEKEKYFIYITRIMYLYNENVNELVNCHRNEINYLCVSSVKLTIFTCFKRKIERA